VAAGQVPPLRRCWTGYVSDAIDWAPARWQGNPDDAEDLVRVAQYLLSSPQAVTDGQQALGDYVSAGVKTWTEFVAPSAS
jgi:hypothetical protein